VFGVVTAGMDVVQKIAAGEIDSGSADRPKNPVRIIRTEVIHG
jgi:cyclophilin family peptidyl-prolyl cis-trans isomerase